MVIRDLFGKWNSKNNQCPLFGNNAKNNVATTKKVKDKKVLQNTSIIKT